MITLKLVLLILAFVVFAVAALGVSAPRFNLTALGLALWVLASVVA